MIASCSSPARSAWLKERVVLRFFFGYQID
jgi:hypothetical protein